VRKQNFGKTRASKIDIEYKQVYFGLVISGLLPFNDQVSFNNGYFAFSVIN